MRTTFQFDPISGQIKGSAGTLAIDPSDELSRRFLMLVEGECLAANVTEVAQKYGCCRQRYYQIRDAFLRGGLPALEPKKTGPKSNYRRTDQAVRQVLRHRFLDPDASAQVIAQKLRQTQFPISIRSVERIIADYGLQKKTLLAEPQKTSGSRADKTLRKAAARRTNHSRQPGTGRPAASGR